MNLNGVSQTLVEGAWGNQKKYARHYTEKPFANMTKGKALDIGGHTLVEVIIIGILKMGRVSQTVSAGAFEGLIAVDDTWGHGGSILFLGINVSGKVAVEW